MTLHWVAADRGEDGMIVALTCMSTRSFDDSKKAWMAFRSLAIGMHCGDLATVWKPLMLCLNKYHHPTLCSHNRTTVTQARQQWQRQLLRLYLSDDFDGGLVSSDV